MSKYELKAGSACTVEGMRENLVDRAFNIRRKDQRGTIAIDQMLTLEIESHMLPAMERGDWAREANRHLVRNRAAQVQPGHFYGKDTQSLDYLLGLHRNGWPEGVAKAMALAEQIRDLVPVAQKTRRKATWSHTGEEIDMRRVYAGRLDTAWRTTRKERRSGPKVISIDVDVCYNCHVNAENLFWSGACAVAITDVLEDMGYRVELFTTAATDEGGKVVLSRLVVKRSDEPLNANAVAALAAHPATYRYHHLNAWSRAPWNIGWGFGHAIQMMEPLNEAVAAGVLEGSDVQVTGALSKDAAVKALQEAIAKLDPDAR
jgi:hypothetical protein